MGKHRGGRTAAVPHHVAAAPKGLGDAPCRALQILAGNEQGQSLVEFALVSPLLILLLLGIIKFGIVFNNYLTLTNATNIATQQLSVSRGQTGAQDPCKTVYQTVFQAAPFLTQANLKFTITITPLIGSVATLATAQASPSCSTTAAQQTIAAQSTATVAVTYPCNLTVFGINFAPGCTLTAQTAEAIQ
jgi:Flp pilus assembly protein TadG